jgi:enoyl-CoA hydratase/carnithine racemase/phosphoglycolate phosphatase-like HAD superfamily hydrolase
LSGLADLTFERLGVRRDGDLLWVTLSDAERANALSPAMIVELTELYRRNLRDEGIRAVLLSGAGKNFSAGADLEHLRSLRDAGEEENLRDSMRLKNLFEAVLYQDALTIALVHGACVAGGCGLATAHDFVVAAEDARFLYSEVRIGFVAALVATYLPLRLRGSDIRELLLFPRFLDAARALEIGLRVDRPHQAAAPRRPRQAAARRLGSRRPGQRRFAGDGRLQARHRHLPRDQEAPCLERAPPAADGDAGVTQRLVLFDIDGTLVDCGPQVRPLFASSLEEVFGTTGDVYGYRFAGRTDPRIVLDLLTGAGLPEEEVRSRLPRMKELYLGKLERALDRAGMRLLPGVLEMLEELAGRDDVVLALLTGNWEPGARTKLARFDLNRFFAFGAFGCDAVDRTDLPPVALDRAETWTGRRFAPEEALIIGDSIHDIACARAHGIPVLAVATGHTPAEALHEAGADWVVPDLRVAAESVEWLGAPAGRR